MEKPNVNLKDLVPTKIKPCKHLVANATGGASYILAFLLVVFLSNIAHALLRTLRQPRVVAESLVGLIAGNIVLPHKDIFSNVQQTLNNIKDFGMIFHMFALGLEMDIYMLFQRPSREAIMAYSGMLSTLVLACFLTPFLDYPEAETLEFTFSLSVTLTGTASPLLTRIITDNKIGKSEIGRVVVAAGIHSDLLSSLLISIGFVILSADKVIGIRDYKSILKITSTLIGQILVTAGISPILMEWVNHENPPGKRLKGSHMVLSVAFVVIICSCSTLAGYSPVMSAFLSGIVLPREGRLSKMMISKVNYFLNSIFYPIFFVWVGLMINFDKFEPGNPWTWARMIIIFLIATFGKVVGTFLSGLLLGFNLQESVALGLLLNVKGHFHMYLALSAVQYEITTSSTGTGLTIAIFFTAVYAPLVVGYIIGRVKKRSPNQRMALQWLDPIDELRILLGVHSPQQLPSTINFIEISRGRVDPAIMVYVTDMMELTDQIESTNVRNQGKEGMTVTDKAVVEMRDQISGAIKTYEDENGGSGMTVRRMLALSAFSVMHQDICIFAENMLVSLVVLPFHKYQTADGNMIDSQPKFRYVNRKVLQHAPCSVGILVDRGFGNTNKISRSSIFLSAAVIFIGGKDDREALAYASRVAMHPGVKLTVIRFLLDTNSSVKSTRLGTSNASHSEQEEEMNHDDEFFADFYDRHVGGTVIYMEKFLKNSSETMSALQSLEGKYGLIIVGRGGRVNSALTAGMNDWQQCPELGPVGDLLSGSASVVSASILIIQQHRLKGELAALTEEFSVM